MTDIVGYDLDGDIGIITLDNPPVNALGHELRAGIVAALDTALADKGAEAIVIRAAGRTFPAGADIREFGRPPQDPWLPEVCNRIEAATKPVVAALHGTALGGGFELALAAHFRIAAADAVVGLPEVKLGLLPGAGGTQRAPRLCGGRHALDLMLSARPVPARKALEIGLLDEVAEDDLYHAALALARKAANGGLPPRPTRERRRGFADPVAYEQAVREWREKLANSPLPAPGRIVDCVEAALLLPFEAGLEFERAAFEELMNSPQSAALRHVFLAERRAAKQPELKQAEPRPINRVGVIGSGLMGSGIAVTMLDAGLPVTLIERDQESLQAGISRIETIYARAAARGRLDEQEAGLRLARLSGAPDPGALGDADLVIEAVPEDMEMKKAVLAAAGRATRPGTILATNTSYLDVNALQVSVPRPENLIGLHFFSPAHVMKLLEIVVARQTAPDVVATAFALARRIGKVPVRAGVGDGFIGNRVLTAWRQAADEMLEEGATPCQIDAAMREFGFRLGPYQVLDLAGLDISWARRKRLASTRDPEERYVEIGDMMCELGWFGQKAGKGYYLYDSGDRRGRENPDMLALLDELRAARGISPRHFPADEIRNRCLAAMANQGARLVEEEIARCPGDVDVVMVHGFGFPRWRGGPMQAADAWGLLQVRKQLQEMAEGNPKFWTPAPLLNELIKNGMKFASLNG